MGWGNPLDTVPSAGEAPVASNITSSSALISWGPPTNNGGHTVDKYELQVATGSGFSASAIVADVIVNDSGSASHTVSGLDSNTKYYARVRAHNSVGWGDWTSSTYCPFTTLAAPPSTPTALAETDVTPTSVSMAWRASNANGGTGLQYEVQAATDSGFTNVVEDVFTPNNNHVSAALNPATTYYFRVRANTSAGNSGWSSTMSQLTPAAPVYTDASDVMGKMNNLASAVADKLLHLGTFVFKGRTAGFTIASSGGTLEPDMQVQVGAACTQPDPPLPNTPGDGHTNIYTIEYPGTYHIEFGVNFISVPAANQGNGITVGIFVNGHAFPQSTDSHGGIEQKQVMSNNEGGAFHTISCVRQLAVGDTIGFYIVNNTGLTLTQGSPDGGLTMWSRVTMVGF